MEDTQWPRIEPTTPSIPFYPDFIGIPPPPPKRRKARLFILLLIVLVVLAASAGGVYAAVTSYQHAVQTEQAQRATQGTVNAHTTATVLSQNTSVAATHSALNATSTQISTNVTATAIHDSIDATLTASIPTPTPVPSVNTAEDLYGQFVTAGIAMGNVGTIANNQWLQGGFSYYPGKGNVSFIDEASYGRLIIALFSTDNGASVDASQTSSTWGTYQLGTCLLFYQLSSTNLTPYEQVMQQYCF